MVSSLKAFAAALCRNIQKLSETLAMKAATQNAASAPRPSACVLPLPSAIVRLLKESYQHKYLEEAEVPEGILRSPLWRVTSTRAK